MRDRLRNREVFARAGITPRMRFLPPGTVAKVTVTTAKIRAALRRPTVARSVKNRLYQMLLVRKYGLQ